MENLHYDLTEDHIYVRFLLSHEIVGEMTELSQDLFNRIAPVLKAKLVYDRAGRSEGVAFVTYAHVADARTAIREFDGANAKGQPIRLYLLPPPRSARPARRDNPFDRVENPRSLFDRIEAPSGSRGRRRSESPYSGDSEGDGSESRRRGPRRGPHECRSDLGRPAPDNIDRYVPGQTEGRSPVPRSGRRPGERREQERNGSRRGRDRGDRSDGGARMVNGRPRKTHEELDAEMEDYWSSAGVADPGAKASAAAPAATAAAAPAATAARPTTATAAGGAEDDIDMIE